MLKKVLVTASISCVVIASIASVCSAGVTDHGITHGFNGTYGYDQAWVDFTSTDNHDYYVKVYVKKNGTRYGYRRTTVSSGHSATCCSENVQGSGGKEDWSVVVKN